MIHPPEEYGEQRELGETARDLTTSTQLSSIHSLSEEEEK